MFPAVSVISCKHNSHLFPLGSTYHLRVSVEGGQVQRGPAALVCVGSGRAFLHQGTDQWEVAFQTRPAQSCKPLLVH